MNSSPKQSITNWLEKCRDSISEHHLNLLPLFDLYAAEARHGYLFIKNDLNNLPKGSDILEIGAGPMLLSSFLQQDGYKLTALEPSGVGFAHFDHLRDLVLKYAQDNNSSPSILPISAETLQVDSHFDFAFSINVMEHVTDIAIALKRVVQSLNHGGSYHFTCPNYLFPYEPHFNIPTLFSKQLTETFFAKKIFSYQDLHDPAGMWESLNWVTTPQLSAILKKLPDTHSRLNKKFMVTLLERTLVDKDFAARRSPFMCKLIALLVKTGLHRMIIFSPAICLPIIDCTVVRLPNNIPDT